MAGQGPFPPLAPHPPCQSIVCINQSCESCDSRSCCASIWGGGEKFTWPELVGKKGDEAKAVIESQYKIGTAYVLKPPHIFIQDFCCNRIRIIVNNDNVVIKAPIVG